MKRLFFSALFLVSNLANAGLVNTTNVAPITKINAYAEFGGGEVILYTQTGLAACPDAVYLTPSSAGFNTILSLSMLAYPTKQKAIFGVWDDRIFAGGITACQVDSIRFQ